MHRLHTLLFAFGTLAAMECGVQAQPFTYYYIEQQAQQSYLGTTAWGDFDQDGDFDLLVSGTSTSPLAPSAILDVLADAEHTVIKTPGGTGLRIVYESMLAAQGTGVWLSSAVPADVDGDGNLDLLVSGATSAPDVWAPVAAWYRFESGGLLVRQTLDVEPLFAGASAWFDADNDGRPDLLMSGIAADGTFRTHLYRNRPEGLVRQEVSIPGLANGAIAPADFDGDGDTDVAVNGRLQNGPFVTRLYLNQDGQFEESGIPLPGVAYGSLDWGDVDADGDLDLLLAGAQSSPLVLEGVLAIYQNSAGGLVEADLDLPPVAGGTARFGDYDLDGMLDIVWSGAANVHAQGKTGILRNLVEHFEQTVRLPGAFPANVAWGDIESDGDLDLTVSGLTTGSVPFLVQYQNDAKLVNLSPSVPDALTAAVDGNAATLSWNAATDAETPGAALTYNLRLGSQPGTADILHPDSDVSSGRRLVSTRGNLSLNRSWQLRDLLPGTYYWSVQAIDGSYHGSAFAPEQSFTIGAGAGSDVTTNLDGQSTLPSEFAVLGSYPNPFRSETRLRLALPSPERVQVEVFDVVGSRVRTMRPGELHAGLHEITWNGRGDRGEAVSSGVYLVRVTTSSGWTGSTKLVVLK